MEPEPAVNVLDDDGLADVLLGVLRKDARGDVGAVAGFVGNDHGHGAVGGPAGGFRRSFGGSFGLGFCGSLGLRGSLGLAAGTQREHHTEGKEQGKCFFSFFLSFLSFDEFGLFVPPKRCCNVTRKFRYLQGKFYKKSKQKKNMLNLCKISVNFLFSPGKKASRTALHCPDAFYL